VVVPVLVLFSVVAASRIIRMRSLLVGWAGMSSSSFRTSSWSWTRVIFVMPAMPRFFRPPSSLAWCCSITRLRSSGTVQELWMSTSYSPSSSINSLLFIFHGDFREDIKFSNWAPVRASLGRLLRKAAAADPQSDL